jgi:hypothetical protein
MRTEEEETEGFVRSLDFFRFTPAKFLEQTIFGALLSLALVSFSVYLIMHEANNFLNKQVKSEILFENLHIQDLEMNIDVDLLNTPCDITDLRFTAKRGRTHTLRRYRILKDKKNKKHSIEVFNGPGTVDQVVESIKNEEGCKIHGTFYIHLLSNNIYLGFGNPILMSNAIRKLKNFTPKLDHIIRKLTIGPEGVSNSMKRAFDLKGLNTLGDHKSMENRSDGYGGPIYHSYFLTAVPNVFDRMFHRVLETFQYTASSYMKRSNNAAIVFV